jgi:hypothetical protein
MGTKAKQGTAGSSAHGSHYSGPEQARRWVDIENPSLASLSFAPVHLRPLVREAALASVMGS